MEDAREREEKTIEAGRVLREVVKKAAEMVKPGAKLIDVAEFVEGKIIEMGAKPAFPCNISINAEAAHYTPKRNDERKFEKGDIVKLDVGAHIDGYIADMAVTVDLGDHSDLVSAAKDALFAAIDVVKPGVSTTKIGEAIEETIRSYGYEPIRNLTGHGLRRYLTHTQPSIYNYPVKKGEMIEEGMIIAIEPFATDGEGYVRDSRECEIFSLLNPGNVRLRSIRMKVAREILSYVIENYKTLPFAKRWLPKAPEVILSRMVRERTIRAYPVLVEVKNGLVSQWEHTLIVEDGGARIVTGDQ